MHSVQCLVSAAVSVHSLLAITVGSSCTGSHTAGILETEPCYSHVIALVKKLVQLFTPAFIRQNHNYSSVCCVVFLQNFLALCASNYYNGCVFHRNIKGFIVQTGDPTGNVNNNLASCYMEHAHVYFYVSLLCCYCRLTHGEQ